MSRFGNVSFAGEGDQTWLSEQLKIVLDAASSIPVARAQTVDGDVLSEDTEAAGARESGNETLATYLRAQGAGKNQTVRFLATAGWLFRRGQKNLPTRLITKALSDNHQGGVTNPSQRLNQNVAKGFCEKTSGGRFFITPEDWQALGDQK
jgi:hypothetical protein